MVSLCAMLCPESRSTRSVDARNLSPIVQLTTGRGSLQRVRKQPDFIAKKLCFSSEIPTLEQLTPLRHGFRVGQRAMPRSASQAFGWVLDPEGLRRLWHS